MTLEQVISAAALGMMALGLVIAFYVVIGIQARTGEKSSPLPSVVTTSSPRKPSIERSETNSTVLITVQANPARPLVWSEEPVNGSTRLVKLTVVYERSLDDSESAILKSGDFALRHEAPDPFDDVDDDRWIARVKAHQENL